MQGVRQGDPLGPLLFSLGLHPVLKLIQDTYAVRVVAYLDDVYLVGEENEVREAFTRLGELATGTGLRVNREKSKLLDLATWNNGGGIAALSTPVGGRTFINEFLRKSLTEKADVIGHICEFAPRHALSIHVESKRRCSPALLGQDFPSGGKRHLPRI